MKFSTWEERYKQKWSKRKEKDTVIVTINKDIDYPIFSVSNHPITARTTIKTVIIISKTY